MRHVCLKTDSPDTGEIQKQEGLTMSLSLVFNPKLTLEVGMAGVFEGRQHTG